MADDDFEDGWGEDLDDLLEDDDEVKEEAGDPLPSVGFGGGGDDNDDVVASDNDDDDGWGDDGLGDLDVSADAAPLIEPEHQPVPKEQASQDSAFQDAEEDDLGWEDDEDIFVDSSEVAEDVIESIGQLQTTPQPVRQQNPQIEQTYRELESYVESLMILLPSINAVLDAEYNHASKAHELLHYYSERPQLRDYTINKELSRMDYQVILEHDQPIEINDKNEIAQLFRLQQELDLLVRCANQSLLADLLQVMTSHDGLVRPQYMATCLAESCSFVLRCRPGTPGGLVECNSQMVLSLPEPSGQRYPVAKLSVHILLGVPTRSDQAPLLEYKLRTMDIVIPSMDVLRPTAQFLLDSGLLDHPPESPFPMSPGGGGGSASENDTFRDVFLQQSQTMLQDSAVGLASAWKQIDSVAGLSGKVNMVKKILPTDSGILEAAMQEHEAFQQEMEQAQQQMQQHRQTQTSRQVLPPQDPYDVPVSYPPSHTQKQPLQQPEKARPTSILGSFMGRLAKSVAIPEEDPSIYEQYTGDHSGRSQGAAPAMHLYRTQSEIEHDASNRDDDAPNVQLYRKQNDSQQQNSVNKDLTKEVPVDKKASPWLDQMANNAPPSGAAPVPSPMPIPPQLPAQGDGPILKEESSKGEIKDDSVLVHDGWGEDDDFGLDDIDNNDNVEEEQELTKISAVTQTQSTNKVRNFDKGIGVVENPTISSDYNPDDGIVETRKRWVNPRPGPRYISLPS